MVRREDCPPGGSAADPKQMWPWEEAAGENKCMSNLERD